MVFRYYNITNLTTAGNDTTILTFVQGVNAIMSDVPALLMLVAVQIILIMALIRQGFDIIRSLAASSFVMFVLALIIYPTGLIGGKVLIIFSILFPLSVFVLWVWGGTTQ